MASLDAAISGLVSRLEAITSRLEGVEKQLASGGGGGSGASASSGGGSSGVSSAFVTEYEDLINQHIKSFVELSSKIGSPELTQQAQLVLQAVQRQKEFLEVAANSKKASDADLQKLLAPTSALMGQITEIRDKNRTSKVFNHLSTVSEGIGALGWVLVSPTPGPHVADMRGGSEFYSNRILSEHKGKNQQQVDWVLAYNGFLKELQAYIKKHHTTGVSWNARGGDALSFRGAGGSSSSAAAPSSGGPPPPPGPPPPGPPPPPVVSSGGGGAAPDMAAVFSSLNKGEAVTSGLKKVTSDMKTKNRTDKASGVVSATSSKKSEESSGKKAEVKKPPYFGLDGNKWRVEYQVDNKSIVIDNPEVKHTVYIYKCKNSTVQIKGKVNSIAVDDCSRTAVVFDNAIASLEVVNCRSVEVQVTGKVPNFAVDKTSGIQLYLSKESLDCEIITSKSDQMNVLIPGKEDVEEKSIPEQFKTVIKNGNLITAAVEHKD